jgi:YidC/Oxa1 family membrane protein insertase
VFGKIEKEEEAAKLEAIERRSANAPAPGVKPTKARKTASNGSSANGSEAAADADGEVAELLGESADSNGSAPAAVQDGQPRSPRPGARPASRPKKRKR